MSHADAMDAAGYWNQFVTGFYFDKVGQTISATLIEYEAEGPSKDPVPKLYLQTEQGARRFITVTQERLKAALQEACPARGDRLKITYTGDADRAAPGMTKAKLFTVEVRRKGSQTLQRPPGGTSGEVARENGTGSGK